MSHFEFMDLITKVSYFEKLYIMTDTSIYYFLTYLMFINLYRKSGNCTLECKNIKRKNVTK